MKRIVLKVRNTKKRHEGKVSKILSLILSVSMVVTTVMVPVSAYSKTETIISCDIKEHTHDENCYERHLVCGKTEDVTAGHVHTAECMSEPALVCEDTSEEHVHDDSCYSPSVPICGLEESAGTAHVHDDSCYEDVLICEKQEHVHGEECLKKTVKDSAEFSDSVIVDKIKITATAPAGVIPEGATLDVKLISSKNEVKEIEDTIEDTFKKDREVANSSKVEQSYSFDIQLLDSNNRPIEPDTTKGDVLVSFTNVGAKETVKETDSDLLVYYVTDELDEAEKLDSYIDTRTDSVYISAEHFSIYTVVITSGAAEGTVLHYYQGRTKAASYFTLYSEADLLKYKELLEKKNSAAVKDTDRIETILDNSDSANPSDGITGTGQSTSMTIANLNFSAKLMSDITVTSSWTPISKFPSGLTFDGNGHKITFKVLPGSYDWSTPAALVTDNKGTVKNITLWYSGDKNYTTGQGDDDDDYVTVTVFVDGNKTDIGEAITGAETLAISSNGEDFIPLERSDDLAVYRKKKELLDEDKVYKVYYAYENENETISAASISLEKPRAELNYVSVSYDLEGANTKKLLSDGTLSEHVMAAIRVEKQSNGSFVAMEDYETVIEAVEGYTVPSLQKNVTVTVGGSVLPSSNFTYNYDSEKQYGILRLAKEKITGPMVVKVRADSLEDSPSLKVILHTKGGSISDSLWEKTGDSTYECVAYEDVELPTVVTPINDSDSIKFGGWYKNIGCTTAAPAKLEYKGEAETIDLYAQWVIARTEGNNADAYYKYSSNGNMYVQGWPADRSTMTTYSNAGFRNLYRVDESNASYHGTGDQLYLPYNVNAPVFTRIGSSNIYVAEVYTLENKFINVTYIFENRSDKDYTGKYLYWGCSADVQIAGDDHAVIRKFTNYLTMTASSSYGGKEFRLYTSGTDFGVDPMYTYWYGGYSSAASSVFTQLSNPDFTGDSGLAFSWKITNIPANGIVTRTTKIGMGNPDSMKNITATCMANDGVFADAANASKVIKESDCKEIIVNADNTVTVKRSDGAHQKINPPVKSGYKFDHWSTSAPSDSAVPAGKVFEQSVVLYANWIPQPDKRVTNNSSVQKVHGNDNLLVPKSIANIAINVTTAGAAVDRIEQGDTVADVAGFASGFTGTLVMEGEDDRYLLPDDIEVYVLKDGSRNRLTKGTGYTYKLWNNRRSADLNISKQYITDDLEIVAIGYALPAVTATSVSASVSKTTLVHGERATLKADAITSKNHVSSYQWYIAPYYDRTENGQKYWTYENQNGTPLTNGTLSETVINTSGNPVVITGADKATLRIDGLDVNKFTGEKDSTGLLNEGGYHFYCVVTSTRNITGQSEVAVSNVAEIQVVNAVHPAPTGLEGSATSYAGSSDGSIYIANQQGRPAMQYKKSTSTEWLDVSAEQLAAGQIDGLSAGTYQFKYPKDENNDASDVTLVDVASGKYIMVTYQSLAADDEDQRYQYKHVAYGAVVKPGTESLVASDKDIVVPARKGYSFTGWSPAQIDGITENTIVNAEYSHAIYKVTLDNMGAGYAGTSALYEKYEEGFYRENECLNPVNGTLPIDMPSKEGYIFEGYYTSADGGRQMINADGCILQNMTTTSYQAPATLYAHFSQKKITFNSTPGITVSGAPSEPDIDTSYSITLTKSADKEANTISIYSDGLLKKTIAPVEFVNNKYTLTLKPSEVGGGNITFVVVYVEPTKDDDSEKTDEEIKEEAENKAEELKYSIVYKEVNGSKAGTDFTGTFTSSAPTEGIKGVATALPTAVKSGYTFAGWFSTPRGLGGTQVMGIPADYDQEEMVLYAKWVANRYEIKFETNRGHFLTGVDLPNQYQHDGQSVPLPAADTIVRDNFDFRGWFDNESCQGSPIETLDPSQIGGVTYYAGWSPLPLYTVTLTDDGKSNTVYTIKSAPGYSSLVYKNNEYKFEVTPSSAYEINSVKADGKLVEKAGDYYVIPTVLDNTIVTVTYTKLVETSHDEASVASIALADGTVGYFDDIKAAIRYAERYGTNSVIKLMKDVPDAQGEIPAGGSFAIDLNGHTVVNANLIISAGCNLTLLDSTGSADMDSCDIKIENRGTVINSITIDEFKNYGNAVNTGVVKSLIQENNSEAQTISRFANSGSVDIVDMKEGYFVSENGQKPATLRYTTVMNNNEYYADFRDAIAIANNADSDVSIKMHSTVDNNSKTLNINNTKGHTIAIDMNKENIENGSIIVGGNVEFNNAAGSAAIISKITGDITNNGSLSIKQFVTVSGTTTNKGTLENGEGASIEGATTNEEGANIINKGTMPGGITNNGGSIDNEENATVGNVVQYAGDFENHGNTLPDATVTLNGGGYQPYPSATPTVPTNGADVKIDSNPVKYYASLKDAIDDINEEGGEGQKVTITVLRDIENLGGSPVVINGPATIDIDLNGHTVTPGEGQGLTVESGSSLELEDKGSPKGSFKPDITNKGTFTNDAKVEGPLTNTGKTTNNGSLGDVEQRGGSLDNKAGATITKLTQTGGQTNNDGEIGTIDVKSGAFKGDENSLGGKVAKTEIPDGNGGTTTIYFVDVNSALDYSAKHTPTPVIQLIKDIPDEAIDFASTEGTAVLDLNGHTISGESITTETGTNLVIKDDSGGSGQISAPVTNKGNITNEAKISGNITNSGSFDNKGTVSSVDQTSGQFINENGGQTGTITQTGGKTTNKNVPSGGISEVILTGGGYSGNEPTTPITGKVAQIGDTIYTDIKSAVEDANNADGDVTITLIGDVSLPTAPDNIKLDNKNGNKIELDVNGKTVSGGPIEVAGGATISDIGSPKGSITSDVIVDENATLVVNSPATISGTLINSGQTTNNGTVSKVEQKDGQFNNGGTGKVTTLEQTGGKVENDGNITKASVSGGEFDGDQPGEIDYSNARASVVVNGVTKYFDTVSDAVAASSYGAVITLLADISSGALNLSVPGITIDLNGHNVNSDVTLTNVASSTNVHIVNSKHTGGKIDASFINNGEIIIGSSVTVEKAVNNGQMNNSGTIKTLENHGSVVNKGVVETLDSKGGSFSGNTPKNGDVPGVAKIGDTVYKDIATAIAAANKSSTDVVIELLDDTVLAADASLANTNGKSITLDLKGHDLGNSGTKISVGGTGPVSIKDSQSSSTEGGRLALDLVVTDAGQLTIDSDTTIDGKVTNAGTVINKGTINGAVVNSGTLTNKGTDAYISGSIKNSGQLDNEGYIQSTIENTGSLSNKNTIDGDIENKSGGSISNIGSNSSISGQIDTGANTTVSNEGTVTEIRQTGGTVTNKTGASVTKHNQSGGNSTNEGTIDEGLYTGGSINNKGTINTANVVKGATIKGNKPVNGATGIGVVMEVTNPDGSKENYYFESIEDAVNAQKENPSSTATITILASPATVSEEITIPHGTSLVVPDGMKLEVTSGGKINVEGTLDVASGGAVDISSGSEINNNGTFVNNGAINNAGTITKISQSGGTLTNEPGGSIDKVAIDGGTVNNKNTTGGINSADISGGSYKGKEATNTNTDSIKAVIENSDGTVEYYKTITDATENSSSGDVIKLTKDVEGGTLDINKPGVVIDLNGHEIGENVVINNSKDATDTTITNSSSTPANVNGSVTNGGGLKIDEKVKVEGTLTNSGDLTNDGSIKEIKQTGGTVTNSENATIEKVVQTGGTIDNQGNIEKVEKPQPPAPPIGGSPDEIAAGISSAIQNSQAGKPASADGKPAGEANNEQSNEAAGNADNGNANGENAADGNANGENAADGNANGENAADGNANGENTADGNASGGQTSADAVADVPVAVYANEVQNVAVEEISGLANIVVDAPVVNVDLGEGSVKVTIEVDKGIVVNKLSEILDNCLDAAEIEGVKNGDTAEVRVRVIRYLDEDEVDKETKQVMTNAVDSMTAVIEDITVGQYVEIDFEKNYNNQGWVKIHELKHSMEVVLDIPANLVDQNRTYYILRNHDGQCSVLEDKDEELRTITFETDKFSTYAIIYTDKAKMTTVDLKKVNNQIAAGKSNSQTRAIIILLILLALIFVLVPIIRKKVMGHSRR